MKTTKTTTKTATAPATVIVRQNDERLLSLEADYLRLDSAQVDQDYRDRLSARADEIRWQIAETPAHGSVGMAVKVRILLDSARTGAADWDEPVCQGLLVDLERLSR